MSAHAAFRRQPVPGQFAQQLKAITIPAPTRGIVQHENDAFIGPGACLISDNWFPTLKGVRLRGGSILWCDLHALDPVVPPVPDASRKPVISGFEYISGNSQRMYAAQQTKLFDVTSSTPVLVASGRTSGNYSSAQLANFSGYWLLAVNETGDPVLRFNGTTWTDLDVSTVPVWANNTSYAAGALAKDTSNTAQSTYWRSTLTTAHTSPASGTFADARAASPGLWVSSAADGASFISGPTGTPVEFGKNLSYVAKYRNRLFFVETKSMNVWYLDLDAIGGVLKKIPMSGAASLGGYISFLTNWSIDAGDGIDDKLVVVTSEGEALIWTGSDPTDSNNWRQEGRYFVGPPMGMNGHAAVGGDVLILTTEGIVPLSQSITKSSGEMELALISRAIKRMWREEVISKNVFPWSIRTWDDLGGIFITFPGGTPGNRYCLAMNSATGAFARAVGWDALCFIHLRADMFFGNQDGLIMQMDRSGYDNNGTTKQPYVATLVGGWEMFQARSQHVVWRQARAVFTASAGEPFQPQLDAAVDYVVTIPPPPQAGPDPGPADVWDQGKWGPDMGGNYGTPPINLWEKNFLYGVGTRVFDHGTGYPGLGFWDCAVLHLSGDGTFAEDRAAHPGPVPPAYWTYVNPQPAPPVPTAPQRQQYAQWDQPGPARPVNRNTMWVSIGKSGFSHAPIVQVTVAQEAKPDVELIAISCVFDQGGVNV